MSKTFSIKEVTNLLSEQNYTTAFGYDIIQKDVLYGLQIMNKKHRFCEWVDYTETHPEILSEGYYWLCNVYFNKSQSLIDADVKFFELLIENYRLICDEEKVNYYIKPFIKDDMTYDDLALFVGRKRSTVKKAFYKLPPLQKNNSYYRNKNKYIVSNVCEDLCREYFKQTYLKYLEQLYLYLKNKLLEKGIEVTYE